MHAALLASPKPGTASTGPDGARAALGARWHLAVVAGPDPGWCHPVRRAAQAVGRDPACELPLADPELSRRHLEVRERRGVVEARDVGSANGTAVRPTGPPSWMRSRRRSRLGPRWRPLTEGTELRAGRTVLRVRARPGLDGRPTLAPATAIPTSATPDPGAARGDDVTSPPRPRVAGTTVLLTATTLPLLLTSGATGLRLAAFLLVPLVLLLATLRPGGGPRTGAGRPARQARSSATRTRPPAWARKAPGSRHDLDPGLGLDPASVLLAACSGAATPSAQAPGARPAPERRAPEWTALLPGSRAIDPFTDGPLALVGAPAATAAAARWVACQLAVRHDARALGLRLEPSPGTDLEPWRWLCALPHSLAGGAPVPDRRLVVAIGVTPGTTGEGGAAVASPQVGTLVLVRRLEEVPPWCRSVVEVPDDDAHLVSAAWAQRVGEALIVREATRPSVGHDVAIARLLADPVRAWPEHDDGLGAVFALGEQGPIEVDLARDGPHALVAGTTGSGKSELLLCWVLALACRYPPSALSVVAIDYKGGATFGPLAGLPHVVDVLTDLDAAGTARALAGLRAELARREGVLAAAGIRDLPAYRLARRAGRPDLADQPDLGRLLVVVDEFRALADEHPELMAGLARLAAQGRSLGIHLVLATQRPAGALNADLRANLRVSICLRVLSAGDSLDVIGSADAARLPAVPGRAILHGIGPEATGDVVQAAWGGRAGVARAVTHVSSTARAQSQPRAACLWAPPLPSRVVADRAGEWAPPDAVAGLPMALRDHPEHRCLATWVWPAGAPLVIAGGPGTGRTTALRTASVEALNRGWTVHLVHGPGEPGAWTRQRGLADHPCLGTVVGTADPRRLVRLLDLIEDAPGPALLCVDDVDAVLSACERLGGPSGGERLARILRGAAPRGLAVAVAGPLDVLSARWAGPARHRMVLGTLDAAQASLAGVPRTMLATSCDPGRGILLGNGAPRAFQAFLPAPLGAPSPEPHPAAPPGHARQGSPLRLLPIPATTSAATVLARADRASGRGDGAGCPDSGGARVSTSARDRAVPLGLGGDDAEVIWLGVSPATRIVIAGPPGSGRTSALAWLADRLADVGLAVARVAPGDEPPPGDHPFQGAGQRGSCGPGNDGALLVDDADLLDREAAERVAQQWRSRSGVVIAAVRTDTLTTGFSSLSALLRDARDVLVLAPLRGGPGHVPAGDVLPHADPTDPRRPGRGVVVGPRRAQPVQLPSPASRA